MAKDNPSNTTLNFYWLPCIRAAIALDLNHPAEAVEGLRVAAAYELGAPPPLEPGTLYPVYLRGESYFRLHQPGMAAIEFQKLLDHSGCVMNFPLGALAHLKLGQAYVMAGDEKKAKAAYQDFLTLWKDAEAEAAVLKNAKAQYAQLH